MITGPKVWVVSQYILNVDKKGWKRVEPIRVCTTSCSAEALCARLRKKHFAPDEYEVFFNSKEVSITV